MAGSSQNDDGFREIQLNGKQLVFLFMAVTVVLVVTFLTGVLVGRGVRAERVQAQRADDLAEPQTPSAVEPPPPSDDPTKATPPDESQEEPADAARGTGEVPQEEEAPRAVANRNRPAERPAPEPAPATVAKADASPAPPAAEPRVAAAPAPAPAPAKPEAAKPAPTPASPPAADTTTAPAPARNGYAVQVAAVAARNEANAIADRLSKKGYSSYVEDPRGSVTMFRVRVGTFRTRREAQTIAEKLQREEKFKPWVTR